MSCMVTGSNTKVVVYDETAFNTVPSPANGTLLSFTQFSPTAKQSRQQDQTIKGGRTQGQSIAGNMDVSGQIAMNLAPESCGFLLKHAMGGTVTTTGAGPYTHVLEAGGALPIGFMAEVDYSSLVVGAGRVARFGGCRLDGFELSVPQEGFVTLNTNLMGASYALDSALSDGTPTDNGHTAFGALEAAIAEDGVAVAVITEASVSLANNLDGAVYVIGSDERACIPEGMANVTGSITALFTDATWIAKAKAGTTTALEITLTQGTGDGSAGNGYLKLEIPALNFDLNTPAIDTAAGLRVSFNFTAYDNGTDPLMKITLKNALAAL